MLRSFPLLSVVALLAVAPLALQTPAAQEPAKASAKSSEKAKMIYKRDCALCHNENGDGKTDIAKDMGMMMADWTDPKALADKPDEALLKIIRNGKDKMPAEDKGRANDEELKVLVHYIRGLASATPAAPAAAPATPATPATPAAPGSGR